MRFLFDQEAFAATARQLTGLGLDVLRVSEINLSRGTDGELLPPGLTPSQPRPTKRIAAGDAGHASPLARPPLTAQPQHENVLNRTLPR